MPIWSTLPETAHGWVFRLLGCTVQVVAVVVVLRDLRHRRVSAWDLAALTFVVALGPLAAALFLGVHGILAGCDTGAAGV